MAARFLAAFISALLLASPALWAQSEPAPVQSGDPPGRVGRLSAIEGSVQQRTPDENDWTPANLNYPVTTGFAIAPQEGGRAEIEVGSTALRVGSASELDITNLGDRDASVTLAQGELNVRVGRFEAGERIEIVTPRGVMDILAAGRYHLDAGTTESPTRFEVFNGRAELQRDGGNTELAGGQAALVNPDDSQSLTMAQAAPDPLDQWAFGRDGGSTARPARAASAPPAAAPPQLSPDMTGAADLSAYGDWNTDPQYGSVWYPSGVAADWAPYADGHWAWVDPWGWTWIDDAPWGFAPFHYGRWAHTGIGWGWIPGAYVETPVYAPALVVFFGGGGSPFYDGGYGAGIGWCPLGPGELFVPGYAVSVAYVRNVNITNVNINRFNIRRVNNNVVVNNDPHWGGHVNDFANHRFATVVPANQFGHGTQRVRDIAVRNASVTTAAASLPISRTAAVTPPRTAAGTSTNRAAQFNGAGRPPIPQARTTAGVQPRQPGAAPGPTTPARSVAGHALPALPTAQRGAATAGSNPPSHFGTGARNVTTNAGRSLPAVPPSQGGAPALDRAGNSGTATAGSNPPSRFGTGMHTATTNVGHSLPPVPSAQSGATAPRRAGTGASQSAAASNLMPTGRTARGPFGTTKPNATANSAAPTVTPSSAGRGLSQLPTTRQQMTHPPAPQAHIAQPPTTPTGSAGHRGFAPPATPSPQRTIAAPTRNVAPPPRVQAPVHTAAPTRNFAAPPQPQAPAHTAAPARNFAPPPRPAPAPHVAAPAHIAPPAAPARPVGNAAVAHAPAQHPQPAQHPAPNDKNRNQ